MEFAVEKKTPQTRQAPPNQLRPSHPASRQSLNRYRWT